jgi:hypothetical protein
MFRSKTNAMHNLIGMSCNPEKCEPRCIHKVCKKAFELAIRSSTCPIYKLATSPVPRLATAFASVSISKYNHGINDVIFMREHPHITSSSYCKKGYRIAYHEAPERTQADVHVSISWLFDFLKRLRLRIFKFKAWSCSAMLKCLRLAVTFKHSKHGTAQAKNILCLGPSHSHRPSVHCGLAKLKKLYKDQRRT